MATIKIGNVVKASSITKLYRQGQNDIIQANSFLDVDIADESAGTELMYIPLYAGNGYCVITNIWPLNANTVRCTLYNFASFPVTLDTNSYTTIGVIHQI